MENTLLVIMRSAAIERRLSVVMNYNYRKEFSETLKKSKEINFFTMWFKAE